MDSASFGFALIFGLPLLCVIAFYIASARAKRAAEAAEADAASRLAAKNFRLRQYIGTYVARELSFSHFEVAADFSGAVIVDAESRRFCLVDAAGGAGWQVGHQVYEAANLIGVRLVEDGSNVHESVTDAGEVVGRALLGEMLGGNTGALIGGMTASRQSRSVKIVSRLELQLTLDDLTRPLWRLPLLPQPAPRESALYQRAYGRAQHWEALFRAVKQPAPARRNRAAALHSRPKTLTPGHLADLQMLADMVNDRDVLEVCGYQQIPDAELPALLAYLDSKLPTWREQTSFELGDYLTQNLVKP